MKLWKRSKKILKRSYTKTILAGFCALFFTSMLLCTYLMSRQYNETYSTNAQLQMENVQRYIYDASQENDWDPKNLTEEQIGELTYILSYLPDMTDKYLTFSLALYDHDGNLVTQSSNIIKARYTLDGEEVSRYFSLDSFLTQNAITPLAQYKEANYEDYFSSVKPVATSDALQKGPFNERNTYSAKIELYPDTQEVAKLTIFKQEWSQPKVSEDGKPHVFRLEDETEVWNWTDDTDYTGEYIEAISDFDVGYFPYMNEDISVWTSWYKNPFLQDYPQKTESHYETSSSFTYFYSDEIAYNGISPVNFASDENEVFTYMLVLRYETDEWLAAIDYMKYIYLWGAVLMFVCIIKVLYSTEKTYEKRSALEETRRDFTNAVAHELKTPLGIIRGLTENVKENTNPEKRDYYLDQIIGQTEEMDVLVQQMLYVSKLDSEKLKLAMEPVSMTGLLKDQFQKLDSLLQEKQIRLEFDNRESFEIMGDPMYLEKVLWNLAINAIQYNPKNGTIRVLSTRNTLRIINTGTPIPDEDLKHIFDMFYTSDKSRNSKEKHYGLGLYLAKKILVLHKLNIQIENLESEVQVTITK